MAVVIKLVRKPRTRRTTRAVRREIKKEYEALGSDVIKSLNSEIAAWSTRPKFTKKITISSRAWNLLIKVDKRTRGGKRYIWVDQGTGLYGPKRAKYPIRPRRKKALAFRVPHRPKTLAPGQAMPGGTPRKVVTQLVMHPGIKPRKFSERVRKTYKNRANRRGFYRRTENAARRGFRVR